jgi:acetyl-CoA acyltransferase 1
LIGDIVVGNVLSPGGGAAMARVAQLLSGIPHTVPLTTVNRQCSSGLQAVASVAAALKSGQYEVGIAAGVESMSQDPMGNVMPSINFAAAVASPATRDALTPMGITSENVAAQFGVSREAQDAFAAESHAKAAAAQSEGRFDRELVAVHCPGTKEKAPTIVRADDGIRPQTTAAGLAQLKPAFKDDGSTTAGNSSQVSDGAAAVLMMRRSTAATLGLPVLAVFRSFAVVGVPPAIMGIGPAFAVPVALRDAGVSAEEVDIWEINEAFASQAVYCAHQLSIPPAKLNVNGGAIALGHPLGCTGVRQVTTLVHELTRADKRLGVVSMCIGTGMGAAAVFERK